MKLFLRGIVYLVAITGFTPFAVGQNLYYQGGEGSELGAGNQNFNTAANWSTVPPNLLATSGSPSVPGASNIAIVQIDLNNGTIISDFLTLATGVPISLKQNTQSNTVQGFIVSNVFLPGGTLNLKSTQTLTIAGTGVSTGDFLVDGNATLNATGAIAVTNGTIVIGDNVSTGFEGNTSNTIGGTGTYNITSGSLNYDAAGTATSMFVGDSFASTNNTIFAAGTASGFVTQGASTNGVISASTVTLGSSLVLGYNGGTGSWNVTNGSLLQTGTMASSYSILLGSNGGPGTLNGNTGASGTLSIDSLSTFNLGTIGSGTTTDLELGTTAVGAANGTSGGAGTINQYGTVNMAGTATTVEVGGFGATGGSGGTGNYNLQTGTLNVGTNATDVVAFTLGAGTGSSGTLTLANPGVTGAGSPTLNVGNVAGTNHTTFTVGGSGTGTFNMNAGTANFFVPLTVGASGTVNLNGGTLNIAAENFAASGAGIGALNFGGGTLKFMSSAATTYTDNFGGGILASGTTSTIDASASNLTTVTFGSALTDAVAGGGGGISLIGNGATAFNFASVAGGAANTYSGSTTIQNGTLNATAADFASSNSGSILTIGTGAAPATLNLGVAASTSIHEAISGNGTMNVNFDAAGVTLALTNAGSSLSTVNIDLGADTGPVGIASATAGTLQVSSGSFGTISDAISGGGNSGSGVNIGSGIGSGTVTFANATYTGPTTIFQNYTLNTASLTSSVTNFGGNLNVTGAAGLTGNIVENDAPGIINVTGAAGIVGDVTSNAGTINTTSLTGNIVSNSGTFSASSAVNTVTGSVTNTGILKSTAPLPAVINTPTFTIGGTLTSPGTLVIRTNGTSADDFQVGGAANLDNGTIQVQVVGGGKIGMTTYDIVNAASVTDAGINPIPDTALFTYVLTNTGTVEELTVTQASIASFALTPNQKAVAGAIDGSNSPLFTVFGNIPVGATGSIPAILDQLSPESLQYARNIAFENSNFLAERMNGVDADLRAGYAGLDTSAMSITAPGFESGLGRSLGSLLASNDPSFHSTAPNGVNYYPGGSGGEGISSSSDSGSSSSESSRSSAPAFDSSSQVISDTPNPYLANQHPDGPETPAISEFIGGDVVLADLNQSQSNANAPSSKASYVAGDAAAGVSFRMTSHLAAGVLFDYNHTDAKTDGYGSKTKVDSYSPGLYATYFDHGFYANGLFSFGYNKYDNTRDMPSLPASAHSSPSGQQYVGDLDFGYDFHPDKNWVWGPTLGLTYTHLDIDSFTETGAAAANLSVDSQSVDSLRSRLGGHVIFQTYTGDVLLQPNLSLMWQHEYLDDSSGITSTFPGTNSFTIETAAPSRDSALIVLGLTATLNNSMALYLNYMADVGADDYWAQSVVGGVKARF